MKLKDEILSKDKNGPELTKRQGGTLFMLTGLKFWAPETLPKPTKEQASPLIGALMEFVKTKTGASEIIEAIQIWFPDFVNEKEIHWRRSHKKAAGQVQPEPEPEETDEPEEKTSKSPTTEPRSESKGKPAAKPEPKTAPIPEPKKEPKVKPAQPTKPLPEAKGKGIDDIEFRIKAGLRNLWLVGPAGCGKTTICGIVGDRMEIPVTIISCGAGTSASTFLGNKFPEASGTPFVHAFAQEGIIVLDEFTSLESTVAQVANAALANSELNSTIGTFKRDPNCIIIATSNTFGHGADRVYVANNQLCASTISRFTCGVIEVDYSREYESQYDKEVCEYVWKLRRVVETSGIRKVVSTRDIINASILKEAGMPATEWKDAITANWSKDEKALV